VGTTIPETESQGISFDTQDIEWSWRIEVPMDPNEQKKIEHSMGEKDLDMSKFHMGSAPARLAKETVEGLLRSEYPQLTRIVYIVREGQEPDDDDV